MRLSLPSLFALVALATTVLCAIPASHAASPAKHHASASKKAPRGIEVGGAWAPPSVTTDMGAGYVSITNHGSVDDMLISATSDCCGAIEVHEDYIEGGISRMRRIDRLPLPAHQTVVFEPKSRHLMLIDLKAPLKEGATFTVLLRFAHAPEAKVTFTVSQARLLEATKSPTAK